MEITNLLKEGRRFHTTKCTAVWLSNDTFAYGILLSRKHGKAHDRNRIKRYFREAIRLSRQQLTRSGKLAILPRTGQSFSSAGEIKADVTYLIEQINRTH